MRDFEGSMGNCMRDGINGNGISGNGINGNGIIHCIWQDMIFPCGAMPFRPAKLVVGLPFPTSLQPLSTQHHLPTMHSNTSSF